MTHITDSQKQQIADLRAARVSFRQIAKQTGIPLGTCKTLYYKDHPPSAPVVRTKNGQFKTRSKAGRKPVGSMPASDKARQAAYRQRQRERLQALPDNHHSTSDRDLVQLLALAVRNQGTDQIKRIVTALHGRYCVIS